MKLPIEIILLIFPILVFSQTDSSYVEISGGKLYYETWGTGEPIVFLNGGPGLSSDGYESYAKAFSHLGQIILFDQRGTGKSTLKRTTTQHDIWHLVADLEKLREHLKIEKWVVIGHSFGGVYALHYMSRHSDRVKKVVLSASPEYGYLSNFSKQDFKLPKVENLTKYEYELYQKIAIELDNPEVDLSYILHLKKGLKGRHYVKNSKNFDKVTAWFLKYSNSENYSVTRTPHNKNKLTRKLKTVTTPVLIIHGLSDFLNIQNPLKNHEILQNSTLEIIEQSGHMMILDQPKIYVKKISDFILDNNN